MTPAAPLRAISPGEAGLAVGSARPTPWQVPDDAAAGEGRRVRFAPMAEADLDAVHEIEKLAHAHPWSRRHFADSIAAGHPAVLLLGEGGPGAAETLLGYMVAMPGFEEVHLLNITVAPAHRRQGWARLLLDALVLWSRGQGAHQLWLEVRQGNAPARRLYDRYGFTPVGVRKGYYPLSSQQREDAIVMNLPLDGGVA